MHIKRFSINYLKAAIVGRPLCNGIQFNSHIPHNCLLFSMGFSLGNSQKSQEELHQECIEFDGPHEFCAWPRKSEQSDHLKRMG